MAKLPTPLFDAVVAQLLPFMGTRDERQAELIPSLSGQPGYDRIEWDGAPKVFTVKLVNLLSNDELTTVLRRLIASAGVDKRPQIESLCQQIAAGAAAPVTPQNAGVAPVSKVTLRDVLVRQFKKEDLENLCLEIEADLAANGVALAVNLEVIGGEGGLPRIALNLIGYMERRGYLDYLVVAVKRARPNASL